MTRLYVSISILFRSIGKVDQTPIHEGGTMTLEVSFLSGWARVNPFPINRM